MNAQRDIARFFGSRQGQLLLGVLAVALLVTAGLGGFREAAPPGYPTTGAGTRVVNGTLAITPLCAWTSGSRPTDREQAPGERYLVLRARVQNLTESDNGSHAGEDIVWLPQGRGEPVKADTVTRADDHDFSVQLQPRLPAVLDLAWPIPPGAAVRRPATWGYFGRAFREAGFVQGDAEWFQDGPRGKLVLPVGVAPCDGARGA